MKKTYKMPATLAEVKDGCDVATNITFFLMENGLGIWDTWTGRISADDQRKLFGQFLGKGRIFIDGLNETIEHVVKVCFGTDFQTTSRINCKCAL